MITKTNLDTWGKRSKVNTPTVIPKWLTTHDFLQRSNQVIPAMSVVQPR